MPNGTYGGVRGRKTKVGRKLRRYPPTRLYICKMKKIMKEKNQVVPDEVLSKESLASSRQKPM